MVVSNVTQADGINCAHLINALKAARFDGLTGSDLEKVVDAKRWLMGLATDMANQLKSKSPPVEAPSMKIKAMGPIGSPKAKKKR